MKGETAYSVRALVFLVCLGTAFLCSDGIASPVPQVAPSGEMEDVRWFDTNLLPSLLMILISIVVLCWVTMRLRGRNDIYIRPIKGLDAIDEAIGRATEMGKPILYTPGWGGDIQRPTTIASLNILQSVASRVSEYGSEIIFPTHDPVIMAAAQETIAHAYSESGHAGEFRTDNVYYTTSSQLGYAAAVDGAMTRVQPAAVMLLGTFEGEALLLAETGNSVGAMQIAGTDSTIQLSFFIVACDYTLIGEELFAASGYLTRDEKIISSIKVQDYLKVLIAVILIIGAVMVTFGNSSLADWIGG